MSEADWEVVFRSHSDVEAEVVRALLTSSGFPVVAERSGAKSMATFFGHSAFGEVVLKVPTEMAEQARELLAAPAEVEPEQ
jgi:hypothetical protein